MAWLGPKSHLTPFQRAELAYPLLEIERQLAKQRQLATLKKGNKLPISSFELNSASIKSQETFSSSELKVSQDFGQARG